MTKPLPLPNTVHNLPAETARLPKRTRVLWLCIAAWSVFVALAVWWLQSGHAGPSLVIMHQGDPLRHLPGETFRGFVKTDPGFQRIYPWILFGPYVALAVFFVPLERGRLRLALPVNLAICAAFLVACHELNTHTRMRVTSVTVVKSAGPNGTIETNIVRVQISNIRSGGLPPGEGNELDLAYRALSRSLGPADKLPSTARTNLNLAANFLPPPPPHGLVSGIPNLSLWPILLDLLAYGAVFGLAHSVHFYRRFRERERRALLLESHLARTRLDTLRAQLQPHFLFNSLNAVATLLRRDPSLAEATLMSLSELLRLSLSQSERQEIPLWEELQFVRRYLEIQQTRFGDKLRVEKDIEPGTQNCLVPALLLQPLVENAIRHGLEPAENADLLRLSAHAQNGSLILTVEDNGVGLGNGSPSETNSPAGANSTRGSGIGLLNLRARLEALYGTRQKLELLARPGGGLTVRVEIPCRAIDSAAPPAAEPSR